MSDTLIIILAGAFVTYLARCGGYFVLARFKNLPPRVEAGLNAVPAAVLTAIIAPSVARGGIPEFAALGLVVLLTLTGRGSATIFLGASGLLILLRALMG